MKPIVSEIFVSPNNRDHVVAFYKPCGTYTSVFLRYFEEKDQLVSYDSSCEIIRKQIDAISTNPFTKEVSNDIDCRQKKRIVEMVEDLIYEGIV